MRQVYYLIFLFFYTVLNAHASLNVDSLVAKLPQLKGRELIKVYSALPRALKYSNNDLAWRRYSHKASDLLRDASFKEGMMTYLTNMGALNTLQARHDSLLVDVGTGLDLAELSVHLKVSEIGKRTGESYAIAHSTNIVVMALLGISINLNPDVITLIRSSGTVQVGSQTNNQKVFFRVINNGIGMNAGQQVNVFNIKTKVIVVGASNEKVQSRNLSYMKTLLSKTMDGLKLKAQSGQVPLLLSYCHD